MSEAELIDNELEQIACQMLEAGELGHEATAVRRPFPEEVHKRAGHLVGCSGTEEGGEIICFTCKDVGLPFIVGKW